MLDNNRNFEINNKLINNAINNRRAKIMQRMLVVITIITYVRPDYC